MAPHSNQPDGFIIIDADRTASILNGRSQTADQIRAAIVATHGVDPQEIYLPAKTEGGQK